MAASTSRYGTRPDPGWRRLALLPGLIAAVALLAGLAVPVPDGPITLIRYIVAIFALIVVVFAVQAKQWWWLPIFVAVAIAWNPIWPLQLEGSWWTGAQYVAAILFLVAGWLIRVPIPAEQRRAR